MCWQCWDNAGRPQIDTLGVRAAARAIAAVYECNCVGGNLHVQLDDWNLDDDQFDEYRIYHDDTPDDQEAAERYCFGLLKALTEPERLSAVALHEGFWV